MDLTQIPFEDRKTAEKNLLRLSENLFDPSVFPRIQPQLVKLLAGSPDPDLALTNFERYASAVLNKTELYTFLANNPVAFEYLIRLFSASQFITDVLIRNPEYFDWLLEDRELRMQKGYHELCLELRSLLSSLQSISRQYNALRRFHRRELLRIGARDILGIAEFPIVTAELSDLASSLLQIAIELVTPQIQQQYGVPSGTSGNGFAIIGLGKLGGYELNFSSDIDILFVYGEENETSAGISHFEYYNALAEAVIEVLTKPTAQGYVYRVDTRLRPEGSAGPLARSLESYETYYQAYAETWERIALIKARPVAGDELIGKQFMELIVPFVYRRTLDYSDIEEIQRLKLRLQSEATKLVAVTDEVKSGVGGIREIEFTISLLQLFYGGKEPTLRESNTLRAIAQLTANQHLSETESERLQAAYIFLRNVEHRLQSMALLQTHTLPSDQNELQKLARKLGYKNQKEKTKGQKVILKTAAMQFQEEYKQHTDFVHSIFSKLFRSEQVAEAKQTQLLIETLLDPTVDPEAVAVHLTQFGFQDPKRALRNLHKLYATAGETVSPQHTRKLFSSILPQLFEQLSASADPDTAFSLFEQYLHASKAATAVYSVLAQEPEVIRYLVTLFATSDYLAQILIREPALFDILLHLSTPVEFPALLTSLSELARLRDAEIFRIGLQDIVNKVDISAVYRAYTELAERGINLIYQKILQETKTGKKEEQLPYAIFALGKLGAYEMTFGSDLDLIFVFDSAEFEFYNVLSEKVIRYSNEYFIPVDPRLRPEGGKGILALSIDAYADYFQARASFWERLAYTRARYIAGDNLLGDKFTGIIHRFVYEQPLPKDMLTQIHEMRLKMQTQSETKEPGGYDLKTGFGGLVDIEFILQYYQIKFGNRDNRWRTSKLEPLFSLIRQQKVLPEQEVEQLYAHYQFISRLQNKLRLSIASTANTLPTDERILTRLAKLSGFNSGEQLLTEYQQVTRTTRALFQKIFGI
ncbi:MAG: bifunctional [glutamate--ammonia ligase]-adenylyl-L-tyrosine phosphorylase/[glutamate--ammonia-ligase] adenylyltransferase [bacterium]|nr:bifunctional [glutamate--ammonia ligase]-adenylyl-L-tyrosine phosphorylase/[glutamate--ammonia-ligase] adenylyltransferase [bacterium]